MRKSKTLLVTLIAAVCALFGVLAVACGGNPGNEPEEPKTYSVIFEMNGHGTAPETIRNVAAGSKIQKPEDPTADEWTFGGWFKDNGTFQNEWKFDTDTVNAVTRLYAKWTQVTYTVTFDVQGHGTAPAQVTGLVKDAKVQRPATDPSENGYVFEGWYKESACTNVWNFANDGVTADVTIYAKWKQVHEVTTDRTTGTTFTVTDKEYFSVPATGRYYLSVSRDDSVDTTDLASDCLVDGVNTPIQIDRTVFLTEGTHSIETQDAAFSANVKFDEHCLPFTEKEMYAGETYVLNVLTANGDTGISVVRFGEGFTANNAVRTIGKEDDQTFILEVRKVVDSVYVYEQIKIVITDTNDGISIAVYTQTSGVWGTEPADTLTRARSASEVVKPLQVSATGAQNNQSIEASFNCIYFDVSDYKNQWLEFSGIAAGTTFRWMDLNAGRTGDPMETVSISNGEPVKLISANYTVIGVYLPQGQSSVSFTVKTSEEPKGISEDNPVVIENNTHTFNNCAVSTSYYFTYTPAEAGYYIVRVYRLTPGDAMEYTVASCTIDNVTQTPIQIRDGVEVELSAQTHKIVVATPSYGAGCSITVSFEKVEVVEAVLVSGTYVGTDDTYKYTLVIDAENMKAVSYSQKHKIIGDPSKKDLALDATITKTGSTYSFNKNNNAVGTVTITINKDGSLAIDDSGSEYTASRVFALKEGTYRYSASGDSYNLTISGNETDGYTAKYSYVAGTSSGTAENIKVEKDGETYVLNFQMDFDGFLDTVNMTFTVTSDTTISVVNYDMMPSIEDGMTEEFTWSASTGDEETTELVSGTYVGTTKVDEDTYSITIVVDAANMTVDFTDSFGTDYESLALTNNNGTYRFDYNTSSEYYVTFTVSKDEMGKVVLNVYDNDGYGTEYTATSSGK